MNKVTKGALATAAGVALLLGGGGTLAVWNESVNTSAGTITAGELGLEAAEGEWTSNLSGVVDISSHKVVPGEVLTFTQNLTVTLVGAGIKANLNVVGNTLTTFDSENIVVGSIALKNSDGDAITGPLTALNNDDVVTASTTFTFDGLTTIDLEDVGATYDFSQVAYKLQQV